MAASRRTSIFLLFSGPPLARSRPHSLAAGLQSSSPLLVATFPLALARTLGVASVQNPSLQQWFEYSAKSKKLTFPVCKQRCASTNATRLYFQSTGDAVITQSRSVLDGLEESPGILRLEVKKLESKVSVLKLTLDHHQEELKRINGELHLCKEQLSKEVTLKVEADLETKGANSVSTSNKIKCVFDDNGKLLGYASSPIQIWKEGDCIEQSSTDIWLAVCAAVMSACSLADVDGEDVTGIGFAATCSLVAVDDDGSPVTVSWSGDPRRNVIVWMDHRAVKQAERINSSDSPVLQYCGGALSPEMEPPKVRTFPMLSILFCFHSFFCC